MEESSFVSMVRETTDAVRKAFAALNVVTNATGRAFLAFRALGVEPEYKKLIKKEKSRKRYERMMSKRR